MFINYNGTMLDGGLITIRRNTQVGPNCQFLTPNHPTDYIERRKPIERCSPITIGEDCWLGGGVTVCPGVTIGDRCIIGAGSVVVKDIPADSIAVGTLAAWSRRSVLRSHHGNDIGTEKYQDGSHGLVPGEHVLSEDDGHKRGHHWL